MYGARKPIIFLLCNIIVSLNFCTTVFGQTVPEKARRHMARGETAVEMAKSPEDYEPAIKEFREAARLAPEWADPYYNLGLVQEKAGKLRDAVESLNKYLKLAPDAPGAAKVRELIYRLEYKAEQELSIADIIDVVTSLHQFKQKGRCDPITPFPREPTLERKGRAAVIAPSMVLYHPAPRTYYQNLEITGPILKYTTTVNCCSENANREFEVGFCSLVMEHEIQVVSKTLVKITRKALSSGSCWRFETGDELSCEYRKE